MLLRPILSLVVFVVSAVNWINAQEDSSPEGGVAKAFVGNRAAIESSEGMPAQLVLPKSGPAVGASDETLATILADYGGAVNQPQSVTQAPAQVLMPEMDFASIGVQVESDARRFAGQFSGDSQLSRVGTDLYSPPEFKGGLIVFGDEVALKIGGYVKSDFIYDFNPIDSTDSFVTTNIPVDAPDRTNTRFHARQTRLSFDTRWAAADYPVRMFVEGDFFGTGNTVRLRHGYGRVGPLTVGQTWTTFTDVAAAPATLDFEGSVSSVNRRQALVRWTQSVFHKDLTLALAAEDAQFIIVPPDGMTGDARSPSPDFVTSLRMSKDWGQFQIASLYRLGGFQPTGGQVVTRSAWGVNFTGTVLLTEQNKVYHQIVFGEGIGSYRGLPDAAPSTATTADLLGLTGWMVGYTQEWTDRVHSNLTYAENALDNTRLQDPDDVHRTTYLAANLIWNPVDRVKVGVEYLYGLRQNVDGQVGAAHRIQSAFIFDLP